MERKVKYDYTFKLECVELVLNQDQSCGVVSKQKGLIKSQVQKWVSLFKKHGQKGLEWINPKTCGETKITHKY